MVRLAPKCTPNLLVSEVDGGFVVKTELSVDSVIFDSVGGGALIQSDSSVVKAMDHCIITVIDLEGVNSFLTSEMLSLKKKHSEDIKKDREDMSQKNCQILHFRKHNLIKMVQLVDQKKV